MMSRLIAKKLDIGLRACESLIMRSKPKQIMRNGSNTAAIVRRRIESGGDRAWRLTDFDGMPFTAVSKTLSRLARQGEIQRISKGLYYRPRQTSFGLSRPNTSQIRALYAAENKVFPAGVAAANLLGFTTQNSGRIELATDGSSLPRMMVSEDAIVHTRRPEAWRSLSQLDAAILDFLRNRGGASELPPSRTVEKLLDHFRESGRFERLLKIASTEPPRVRAMLGAIGQQLGYPRLVALRKGLNPLTRFDFGILGALAYAKEWQAKERKANEAF